MSSGYGFNGKEYKIGNATLKIDDDFIVATLLAVVGQLALHIQGFDEKTAATAEKIYDEIQQHTPNP